MSLFSTRRCVFCYRTFVVVVRIFLNTSKSGKNRNLFLQECLNGIYRSLIISINHFQHVIFIEGTFDFMGFYNVQCSHNNQHNNPIVWGHEM